MCQLYLPRNQGAHVAEHVTTFILNLEFWEHSPLWANVIQVEGQALKLDCCWKSLFCDVTFCIKVWPDLLQNWTCYLQRMRSSVSCGMLFKPVVQHSPWIEFVSLPIKPIFTLMDLGSLCGQQEFRGSIPATSNSFTHRTMKENNNKIIAIP